MKDSDSNKYLPSMNAAGWISTAQFKLTCIF